MTRVLLVATVPGHLAAFHLPFVHHFRAKGWHVDGMAAGISGCATCTAAFNNVWDADFSRNPLSFGNLVAAPKTVRNIVCQGHYDFVHVHTPVAAFVVRLAIGSMARANRPKIVYTVHGFHFYRGGNILRNLVYLALEKIAGIWTDQLVVINQEDFLAAKRYRIVPEESLTYMPGIGVDTDYFSEKVVSQVDINKIRDDLGLGEADRLFVMIAEFIPRKRHKDVLRAIARTKNANVHLALAGTGKLMNRMQALAVQLKIQQQVHFLGFRTDIAALLKSSVAVILPSAHEGLPRCLMEAMCMSVPCIGSRIRGTVDLLDQNRGVLVDVGDVESLHSAMMWILKGLRETEEMVARAKIAVRQHDVRKIIELHEKLYDELLEH